jgi:hypothetical protein
VRQLLAHCGYEPTAVLATMGSLGQSLRPGRSVGAGARDQGDAAGGRDKAWGADRYGEPGSG